MGIKLIQDHRVLSREEVAVGCKVPEERILLTDSLRRSSSPMESIR